MLNAWFNWTNDNMHPSNISSHKFWQHDLSNWVYDNINIHPSNSLNELWQPDLTELITLLTYAHVDHRVNLIQLNFEDSRKSNSICLNTISTATFSKNESKKSMAPYILKFNRTLPKLCPFKKEEVWATVSDREQNLQKFHKYFKIILDQSWSWVKLVGKFRHAT